MKLTKKFIDICVEDFFEIHEELYPNTPPTLEDLIDFIHDEIIERMNEEG